jgi:hypothetical protein
VKDATAEQVEEYIKRIDDVYGEAATGGGIIQKLEALGLESAVVTPMVQVIYETVSRQQGAQGLVAALTGNERAAMAAAVLPSVYAFAHGCALGRSLERNGEEPVSAAESSPILDHTYSGPGRRMVDGLPVEEAESLTGAFRVLRKGEGFAVIANGEEPEGVWLVTRRDFLRPVEPAAKT